jgi:hypothetical protein
MISDAQFKSELQILISNAIREDVGDATIVRWLVSQVQPKVQQNY